MDELSEAEIAWMAGLFEGEGCILKHNGENSIRLQLQMDDQDVIERFYALVGFGKVGIRPNGRSWCWASGAVNEVRQLLILMLPWFGERRSVRTLWALEHSKNNKNLRI